MLHKSIHRIKLGRSILFLVLMAVPFALFSQTKLKGNYNPFSQRFVATDRNIVVREFVNGRAGFCIKGNYTQDNSNDRAGFIDKAGKIIVKPVYMNCSPFKNGVALVQDTARRMAMIDRAGKMVIPFCTGIFACQNGLFVIRNKNKDFGISIVTKQNKIIVPFGRYSSYATTPPTNTEPLYYNRDFSEPYWYQLIIEPLVYFKHYLGVYKNNKWSVINDKGKEVSAATFDWIGGFNDTIAPVMVDKKYGITNFAGKMIIPPVYDEISLTQDNYVVAKNNKKTGVLLLTGQTLLPFSYQNAYELDKNSFVVDTGTSFRFKHGVVDKNNNIIVPIQNAASLQKTDYGYFVYPGLGDEQHMLYDTAGNNITKAIVGDSLKYRLWPEQEGTIVYNKKKHRFTRYSGVISNLYTNNYGRNAIWGLIGSDGDEATLPVFTDFWHGVIATKSTKGIVVKLTNGKWGVIDLSGKPLLPFNYDEIEQLNHGFFRVRIGTEYGVVNSNYRLVLPVKYQSVDLSDDGGDGNTLWSNIEASINKKVAFFDLNGKQLTPFKYDWTEVTTFDLTKVGTPDNKWGLVDHTGHQILPCIYDELEVTEEFIVFRSTGLYGMMDHRGKVIRPAIYKNITHDWRNGIPGYVITTSQGKTILLDVKGKKI